MVSSRPHNFFDTASYAKPLRFQINLATFLNSIQKHYEKYVRWGILPELSGVKTRKWQNWLKRPLFGRWISKFKIPSGFSFSYL